MIISNETVSYRNLPCNLIEDEKRFFSNFLEKRIKEAKLLTFEDVNIGYDGIIFKGFQIYKDSVCYDEQLVRGLKNFSIRTLNFYLKFFIKNSLRTSVSYQDSYAWIVDQYSANYFHWFCDALPRLLAMMNVIENPHLLIPESYKNLDYVMKSLEAFSVNKVTFIPENVLCRARKIFFPTYIAESGHYNDSLMREIRSRLRKYFSNRSSVHLGDKLYISREKANRRKVLNETELVSFLNKYGFQKVVLEDFSFEEQVSIVLNVKCLIGNHGAGLTNMLFMESGSKILELRRQGDCFNNCYFSLASALGIRYYYQACTTDSVGADGRDLILSPNKDYSLRELQVFSNFTHDNNLIVDIEKLEFNLLSMGDLE